MAVNDIYEVIDVQEMYDQQVLNVYFYEQRGAFVPVSGSTAQALAEEWADTIMPAIVNVQGALINHVEVRVRNLFDDTDQGLFITGVPGAIGGTTDSVSSFVALGITLNTDNAAVRPGAKRVAGMLESNSLNGVLTGTALTNAAALATALEAPITGGLIIADDIMFPVVVQRVREGSEGAYTYRLPESSGEATVGLIIEALVKIILTSQTSRKVGVGL